MLSGTAAALIAFVVIETRSAQPLLPLWIFADRNRVGVYLILRVPMTIGAVLAPRGCSGSPVSTSTAST